VLVTRAEARDRWKVFPAGAHERPEARKRVLRTDGDFV